MKAKLDVREKLFEKDRESVSAALDSATAAEGELIEVKAELRAAWEKFKLVEEELGHNRDVLKASEATAKGLEVEKFDLLGHNSKFEEKLAEALDDVERWKTRFQNNAFLEETFQKHHDFDGFAKDFTDAGFKFLMMGVATMAPEVDLLPFKRQYAAKSTVEPHDSSGPKDLVDHFVKELNSEYEDDGEEDAATKALKDKEVDASSQHTINSSQVVGLGDLQEVDLLASQREPGSYLGSY